MAQMIFSQVQQAPGPDFRKVKKKSLGDYTNGTEKSNVLTK